MMPSRRGEVILRSMRSSATRDEVVVHDLPLRLEPRLVPRRTELAAAADVGEHDRRRPARATAARSWPSSTASSRPGSRRTRRAASAPARRASMSFGRTTKYGTACRPSTSPRTARSRSGSRRTSPARLDAAALLARRRPLRIQRSRAAGSPVRHVRSASSHVRVLECPPHRCPGSGSLSLLPLLAVEREAQHAARARSNSCATSTPARVARTSSIESRGPGCHDESHASARLADTSACGIESRLPARPLAAADLPVLFDREQRARRGTGRAASPSAAASRAASARRASSARYVAVKNVSASKSTTNARAGLALEARTAKTPTSLACPR